MAQREANARAKAAGRPLPSPNLWDTLDPTKCAPGASTEEVQARYEHFTQICRKRCLNHVI